jgi:hypothetical protein
MRQDPRGGGFAENLMRIKDTTENLTNNVAISSAESFRRVRAEQAV